MSVHIFNVDGRVCRVSYSLKVDSPVKQEGKTTTLNSTTNSGRKKSIIRAVSPSSGTNSQSDTHSRAYRPPLSILSRSRGLTFLRDLQRQGVYFTRSPLVPANEVPEHLITACQTVLEGKSRQAIIRELQHSNLDVNTAVNNLLSREDDPEGLHISHSADPLLAVGVADETDDDAASYLTLFRNQLAPEYESVSQDDSNDPPTSPRPRGELSSETDISFLRRKRRRLDVPTDYTELFRYSDRQSIGDNNKSASQNTANSSTGNTTNNNNSTKYIIQLGNKLEFWLDTNTGEELHFKQIGSLHSELVGVTSHGYLHQWRWDASTPTAIQQEGTDQLYATGGTSTIHCHPRALSIGLSADESVALLATSSSTRATLLSSSGRLATWCDDSLTRTLPHLTSLAIDGLLPFEHTLTRFPTLDDDQTITELHASSLLTIARCSSGAVYWWGIHPPHLRQRTPLDKSATRSSGSVKDRITGSSSSSTKPSSRSGGGDVPQQQHKSLAATSEKSSNGTTAGDDDIRPGTFVRMRSAPIFHAGAVGFTVVDGVPKVGTLLEDAWKLTDVRRFRVSSPQSSDSGSSSGQLSSSSGHSDDLSHHLTICPYALLASSTHTATAAAPCYNQSASASSSMPPSPVDSTSAVVEMPPPPSPASSTCSDQSVRLSPGSFKRKKMPSMSSSSSLAPITSTGGGLTIDLTDPPTTLPSLVSGRLMTTSRPGADSSSGKRVASPEPTMESEPARDDEQDWCLSDVVFVEDGRTQPVGIVLKVDGNIAAVKFLKEQERACLAAGCMYSPVCGIVNDIIHHNNVNTVQPPGGGGSSHHHLSIISDYVTPPTPLSTSELMTTSPVRPGQQVNDPVSWFKDSRLLRKEYLTVVRFTGSPRIPDIVQHTPKRIFHHPTLTHSTTSCKPQQQQANQKQGHNHDSTTTKLTWKPIHSKLLALTIERSHRLHAIVQLTGTNSSDQQLVTYQVYSLAGKLLSSQPMPIVCSALSSATANLTCPSEAPYLLRDSNGLVYPFDHLQPASSTRLDLPPVACASFSWAGAAATSSLLSGQQLPSDQRRFLISLIVVPDTELMHSILRTDADRIGQLLHSPTSTTDSLLSSKAPCEQLDGQRNLLHAAVAMCAPQSNHESSTEWSRKLDDALNDIGDSDYKPLLDGDRQSWRNTNNTSTTTTNQLDLMDEAVMPAGGGGESSRESPRATSPASSIDYCHLAPVRGKSDQAKRIASYRIVRLLVDSRWLRPHLPRLLTGRDADLLTPFQAAIKCRAYALARFIYDVIQRRLLSPTQSIAKFPLSSSVNSRVKPEPVHETDGDDSSTPTSQLSIADYCHHVPSRPDDSPLFMLCSNDTCTFTWTGPEHIRQDIFECRTCGLMNSLCCCTECARICHKGHDCRLKHTSPTAYCDCWEKCSCRSLIGGCQSTRLLLFRLLLNSKRLLDSTNGSGEHLLMSLARNVDRQSREQRRSASSSSSIYSVAGARLSRGAALDTPCADAPAPDTHLDPPRFARDALRIALESSLAVESMLNFDLELVGRNAEVDDFSSEEAKTILALQGGTNQLDDFVFTLISKCPTTLTHTLITTLNTRPTSSNSGGSELDEGRMKQAIGRFVRSVARLYIGLCLMLAPDHCYKKTGRPSTSQSNVLDLCRHVFHALPDVALSELPSLALGLLTPIQLGSSSLPPCVSLSLSTQTNDAVSSIDQMFVHERAAPTRQRLLNQIRDDAFSTAIDSDDPRSQPHMTSDRTDPDASPIRRNRNLNSRRRRRRQQRRRRRRNSSRGQGLEPSYASSNRQPPSSSTVVVHQQSSNDDESVPTTTTTRSQTTPAAVVSSTSNVLAPTSGPMEIDPALAVDHHHHQSNLMAIDDEADEDELGSGDQTPPLPPPPPASDPSVLVASFDDRSGYATTAGYDDTRQFVVSSLSIPPEQVGLVPDDPVVGRARLSSHQQQQSQRRSHRTSSSLVSDDDDDEEDRDTLPIANSDDDGGASSPDHADAYFIDGLIDEDETEDEDDQSDQEQRRRPNRRRRWMWAGDAGRDSPEDEVSSSDDQSIGDDYRDTDELFEDDPSDDGDISVEENTPYPEAEVIVVSGRRDEDDDSYSDTSSNRGVDSRPTSPALPSSSSSVRFRSIFRPSSASVTPATSSSTAPPVTASTDLPTATSSGLLGAESTITPLLSTTNRLPTASNRTAAQTLLDLHSRPTTIGGSGTRRSSTLITSGLQSVDAKNGLKKSSSQHSTPTTASTQLTLSRAFASLLRVMADIASSSSSSLHPSSTTTSTYSSLLSPLANRILVANNSSSNSTGWRPFRRHLLTNMPSLGAAPPSVPPCLTPSQMARLVASASLTLSPGLRWISLALDGLEARLRLESAWNSYIGNDGRDDCRRAGGGGGDVSVSTDTVNLRTGLQSVPTTTAGPSSSTSVGNSSLLHGSNAPNRQPSLNNRQDLLAYIFSLMRSSSYDHGDSLPRPVSDPSTFKYLAYLVDGWFYWLRACCSLRLSSTSSVGGLGLSRHLASLTDDALLSASSNKSDSKQQQPLNLPDLFSATDPPAPLDLPVDRSGTYFRRSESVMSLPGIGLDLIDNQLSNSLPLALQPLRLTAKSTRTELFGTARMLPPDVTVDKLRSGDNSEVPLHLNPYRSCDWIEQLASLAAPGKLNDDDDHQAPNPTASYYTPDQLAKATRLLDRYGQPPAVLSRWCKSISFFSHHFQSDVGAEPKSLLVELTDFPAKETRFRKQMERVRKTSRDIFLEVNRDPSSLLIAQTVKLLNREFARRLNSHFASTSTSTTRHYRSSGRFRPTNNSESTSESTTLNNNQQLSTCLSLLVGCQTSSSDYSPFISHLLDDPAPNSSALLDQSTTTSNLDHQQPLSTSSQSNTAAGLLSCIRVKVLFLGEPGEGSGVTRSFYTTFAEAVFSDCPIRHLELIASSRFYMPFLSADLLSERRHPLRWSLTRPGGLWPLVQQQSTAANTTSTTSTTTPISLLTSTASDGASSRLAAAAGRLSTSRLRSSAWRRAGGLSSRALPYYPPPSSASSNADTQSSLFNAVAELLGDRSSMQQNARLTGMLLELPLAEQRSLIHNTEALARRVDEGRAVLAMAESSSASSSSATTPLVLVSQSTVTPTSTIVQSDASSRPDPLADSCDDQPEGVALFWQPGQPGLYFPRALPGFNCSASNFDPIKLAARYAIYRTVGRIVGICLLTKETCPLNFCRPVLKHILGRPIHWHDFAFYDSTTFEGLRLLMMCTTPNGQENCGTVSDYNLTFSLIPAPEEGGMPPGVQEKLHLLAPNGEEIDVDESNVFEFVKRYTHFKMVESVREPLEQIRLGVFDVLPRNALDGLTAEDLRLLLNGACEIDIDVLIKVTTFHDESKGSATATHSIITMNTNRGNDDHHQGSNDANARLKRWFWSTVRSMDNKQRQSLLTFWTSSPSLPISDQGFQTLPSITIRPPDDIRLPTANTCIARLYLPLYSSKQLLRDKLLQAIDTKCFGFV